MLLIFSERDGLIECLPKGGKAVELGVYRGDWSAKLMSTVGFDELWLVDSWEMKKEELNPFPDHPAHLAGLEQAFKEFYKGETTSAALEAGFIEVQQKFGQNPKVKILRKRTFEVVKLMADGFFDMIYVDANHQYEFVLRDLIEFAAKLRPGGVMILNDFYDSPDGRLQNLGVVGALSAFMKRSGFQYLAATASRFSDIAISNNPNSPYCQEFVQRLLRSKYAMVEIPNSLVPNYSHKFFKFQDGTLRVLPSF
jgi:hypothetical protein